jgi:hypothetical protein
LNTCAFRALRTIDECTTRSKAFALDAAKVDIDARKAAARQGFVRWRIKIWFLERSSYFGVR